MLASLIAIAFLHWVVLVTPGANFLLVGQLAASGQRRAAIAASLGITCVTFTWALLAVLGVGVVFAAHPLLRQLAQIAGGAYLITIAWRMTRSASRSQASESDSPTLRLRQAFKLGFLTNILNPKTALFFGSAFATLLPPDASWGLTAVAVAVVYVDALVWHLFLALAFSHRRVQGGYARQRARLTRVCGALVGSVGLRLLWQTSTELQGR